MIWLGQTLGSVFGQLHADLLRPAFWLAVGKIVWINLLLSGDNALVIAMACRGLHGRHRVFGMAIGTGISAFLLITFTGVAGTLMAQPYLKLVGGLALLVIAAKLLVPEDESDEIEAAATLWHAVRIVVVADIIMSLDNVIAVAAAANGELPLMILGLAISIPMIIAGATVVMLVLDRLPALVWLGALLLGWIAGGVIASDPAVAPFLQRLLQGKIVLEIEGLSSVFGIAPHLRLDSDLAETLLSLLGAAIVLIAGSIWRRHAAAPAKASAGAPVQSDRPGSLSR